MLDLLVIISIRPLCEAPADEIERLGGAEQAAAWFHFKTKPKNSKGPLAVMAVDKGDLHRLASSSCSPSLHPFWVLVTERGFILLCRNVTTGHEYVCRLTDGPCSIIAMGEKAHEVPMLHAELFLILARNVLSHTSERVEHLKNLHYAKIASANVV